MIPVLTKEQAYKLDKETIESGHLTQAELMDNAGKAIAQYFCEKIDDPFNQKVVVVCGKGNNGGDGLIAHHYLKKYNVSSEVVFTEQKHSHANLIKKYKVSKSDYFIYNDKMKFDKYDWIIDGIFGIGLSRELDNRYINIFKKINKVNNIISIDMPSGVIDSESNNIFIISKHTVTFGFPKLSHYMNPVNSLKISDVGFRKLNNSRINKIDEFDVRKIIKPVINKKNVHKKKHQCNIIAGSICYPGAAYLCSMAASKAGSSYVALYTYSEGNLIEGLQSMMPDIIVKDLEYYSAYENKFPLLVGPGGATFEYSELIDVDGLVIDASAISCFNDPDYTVEDNIFGISENSIMTPHMGEFKTFFKIDKNKKINLEDIKKIQKLIGSRIIILKSFNTFIILKDMIYIIDKGPSLLATAGTGDVLSGILISLLSQGYSRLEASLLGTYLHAEAANYYIDNISKDCMTASNLIECIPHAFNKLREHNVN